MDTASNAAQGPNTTAAIVAPTACPVVPPGSGTLNIITTKENAANSAMSGTVRLFNMPRTFCVARIQNGAATTYIAAAVSGLKYPSGMCINHLNKQWTMNNGQ